MRYKIYYQENNKLKTIKLEAQNIIKLKENKNYPNNIISITEDKKFEISLFENDNEKLEMFYEIKIMLNSNLQFDYIIDILLQNKFKNKNYDILKTIKYAIKNGQDIYESLQVHKNYLGNIIIFFKISNENTNLKESMVSLYDMLLQEQNIKQKVRDILIYPSILLASVLFTMYILFSYVVPKFENIYNQFGDNLPFSTKILLDIRYIITEYNILIIVILALLFLFFSMIYKKYIFYIDKVLLNNLSVFSKLYKNIQMYRLFLSISLQINSNENFYNALYNSKDIINNIYLKEKLNYILKDIKNGKSIYYAFLNTNLFDMFTLRLLKTAQVSNKEKEILEDIVNIYNSNIEKNIKLFKNTFEPLLIFILSSIVLWLVLAIMTPIWDLSSVLN